jgi:hypothetical protein
MRDRAAQALSVDILVGHRLHHIRSSYKHVARALDHDGEVGDRGRVDRTAGTRPHHDRDLGDHTRGKGVAQENLGISAERCDAFLDPRSARVIETNHRRPDVEREIHDLAHLLGVRLGQGTAEHGEVLAEHEYQAAIDRAVPGDDTVTQVSLIRDRGVG